MKEDVVIGVGGVVAIVHGLVDVGGDELKVRREGAAHFPALTGVIGL